MWKDDEGAAGLGRPYEKVLEKGPASLSDAELLSVILRSGTKNIPVREMAEEILNSGNPPGLAGLLHGAVEDYKEIRGVGEVKAIQLACVGELSARIWKTAASEKTVVLMRRQRWLHSIWRKCAIWNRRI